MILVDRDVLHLLNRGDLEISPFDPACLGPNSYDVHLDAEVKTYRMRDAAGYLIPLDCRRPNETIRHVLPAEGFLLAPGMLYLGSTVEYVASKTTIPKLNGKSSLGRLGLTVHVTAGEGDYGFSGHWTLEMTAQHPLVIYPGMPVAQILWQTPSGAPNRTYQTRPGSKYLGADVPGPQASEMHRNFPDPGEEDLRASRVHRLTQLTRERNRLQHGLPCDPDCQRCTIEREIEAVSRETVGKVNPS